MPQLWPYISQLQLRLKFLTTANSSILKCDVIFHMMLFLIVATCWCWTGLAALAYLGGYWIYIQHKKKKKTLVHSLQGFLSKSSHPPTLTFHSHTFCCLSVLSFCLGFSHPFNEPLLNQISLSKQVYTLFTTNGLNAWYMAVRFVSHMLHTWVCSMWSGESYGKATLGHIQLFYPCWSQSILRAFSKQGLCNSV